MLDVPGTNFGSVGRGFESLRAGHQFSCTIGGGVSQPRTPPAMPANSGSAGREAFPTGKTGRARVRPGAP